MVRRCFLLITLSAICAAPLSAQAPPKKVLTHRDYDIWNTATGFSLSPDGKWFAYTLTPPEGDSFLVVRNTTNSTEYRFARAGRPAGAAAPEGETPAAPPAPGGPPTGQPGRFGGAGGGFPGIGLAVGTPVFTPDSKKLLATMTPTRAQLDKAKAEKSGESLRPYLAIIDLSNGTIAEKITGIRSYSIFGDKTPYLVMQKEARPETPPADSKTPDAGKEKPKEPAKPAAEPKEKLPTPVKPPESQPDSDDDLQPPAGGGRRGGAAGGGAQRPGGQGGQGGPAGTQAPAAPRRVYGTDLIVRNLNDGKEQVFPEVSEYSITKDTSLIAMIVASRKEETNGVYIGTPGKSNAGTPVKSGRLRYSRLTWDDKQQRLAFFADELPAERTPGSPPAPPAAPKPPKLFLWDRSSKPLMTDQTGSMQRTADFGPATEITIPESSIKAGLRLSDRTLNFSADGTKLALTLIPAERAASPAPAPAGGTANPATATNPDRVDLDLWHWKDEYIQPMQKIRSAAQRNRSFNAVYFFATRAFRQISDDTISVGMPSHGDWAVGTDDRPYLRLTGYGPSLRDQYLVNVSTGEKKLIWEAFIGAVTPSPTLKYALAFDSKDWWSISLSDGKKTNLTAKLPVKFFNEEHDTPDEPRPYGPAQWSADEKHILISDKFDLWKVAVDGSGAENLTKIGRELNTRFRLLRLSDTAAAETPPGPPPTEPTGEGPPRAESAAGFDLSKTWVLAAENLMTRDNGFYRLEPGQKPRLLIMAPRRFGNPIQAKSADSYVLTAGTFSDYADYYATDRDFRELRKITDIQPRVREFNWGKAELVNYTSADGVPLSGILIKPENFDPNKKYPMMVYIYERLSQGLHQFRIPSFGTSINPTFYASNGYLVYMPDICYTIGSPGQSAMKCVLPAIQAVVNQGIVNENAIGIQGHSWGGYQIAYMITQTNRFKAAEAGAPVSNMVSAYGGIRWGTGLPREFQYERTQSRIGATLWQAPMKYIENSPIFMADRVKTPVMILHNDQDDAVPWYQGIEYYLALRRLGKEAYLFNYNDERHGLRRRATQMDYTVRMQQFFDHHLKGAPMPDWMAKGVPFLDREKEKEEFKKNFAPEKKAAP